MIVLDASVVLASAFNEPGKIDLAEIFDVSAISAVNLGEVVTKLQERSVDGALLDQFIDQLRPICHPLEASQAIQAGLWRKATRRLGLSMGDRCCLALGLALDAEVYTAERRWAELDLGVKIKVIR